jgi:hypothetical protein
MAADELQRLLDGLTNAIAALNFYVNPASGVNDSTVGFGRDVSNNLTLFDAVTGTKTLAQLAAGGGGSATPRIITGTTSIAANTIMVHHDVDIADGATLAVGDGAELILLP